MTDERPGAMLTKTQRQFLKGKKEYTGEHAKQQRYQRRQAIKERVRNTMLDFQLLFETWEERGSGDLFGENPASGELGNGISALLALLYIETHQHGRFKNLLLRGVNQGVEETRSADAVMYRTNFNVEPVPEIEVNQAIERYASPGLTGDISDTELAVIARTLRQYNRREVRELAKEAWQKKTDRVEIEFGDRVEDQ